MYLPFIIHYNTGLTDQSSNNHIPLDNEYQALSKPSHAPPPPPPTYYDTVNQNSSKVHVYMYNIQQCSAHTDRHWLGITTTRHELTTSHI